MTAAVIELETEDLARAARLLIDSAVDPIGVATRRLWSALAGCAGMAGSDPGGTSWAAAYDPAAGAALNAALAAGQGVGQLARMLAQSARNYEAADVYSTAGARQAMATAVDAMPVVPALSLPGCLPPPAAGTSPSGGPPGWSLVQQAVGYVWPNGDQGRLHQAAAAWRASATALRSAAETVFAAPSSLRAHQLPEADDMAVVCNTTSDQLAEIAGVHDQLADACDKLAEHIDHLHAEVVGELRSLLEWTAAIEGAGALLSVFTFGLAEAPAQVAEGVRIARTATFVAGCVERFLSAAESLAAGIRAIADEAGAAAVRLGRLLEIPLVEPTLAGVGSLRVLRDAPEIRAVVRMERSTDAPILSAAEAAGGHTIARHVGLTDAQLIARGKRQASTFTDLSAAETVTSTNITKNMSAVRSWLAGRGDSIAVESGVEPSVGRIYVRSTGRFERPRRVRTVLVRAKNGFYVQTSYLLK